MERELDKANEKIQTLEAEKKVLESSNRELQMQLFKLKSQEVTMSNSSANFSNMDLINRVADIEVKVQKILDALEKK